MNAFNKSFDSNFSLQKFSLKKNLIKEKSIHCFFSAGMSNLRPSDDFQFSGYNEGYDEKFREIAKRHLGRKSINRVDSRRKPFF